MNRTFLYSFIDNSNGRIWIGKAFGETEEAARASLMKMLPYADDCNVENLNMVDVTGKETDAVEFMLAVDSNYDDVNIGKYNILCSCFVGQIRTDRYKFIDDTRKIITAAELFLADKLGNVQPYEGKMPLPIREGSLVGYYDNEYFYLLPETTMNQLMQSSPVLTENMDRKRVARLLVDHGIFEADAQGFANRPIKAGNRTIRCLWVPREIIESAKKGDDQ